MQSRHAPWKPRTNRDKIFFCILSHLNTSDFSWLNVVYPVHNQYSSVLNAIQHQELLNYTHFSSSKSCCHSYQSPWIIIVWCDFTLWLYYVAGCCTQTASRMIQLLAIDCNYWMLLCCKPNIIMQFDINCTATNSNCNTCYVINKKPCHFMFVN